LLVNRGTQSQKKNPASGGIFVKRQKGLLIGLGIITPGPGHWSALGP
jgi:hypothetical protein